MHRRLCRCQVFGLPIDEQDLRSYDPELYERKIKYVHSGLYTADGLTIKDLDLYFVDDRCWKHISPDTEFCFNYLRS